MKHSRACTEYAEHRFKEVGWNECELCKTSNSLRFSTHHIVFASEKPRHPELHNYRNLIFLCEVCHRGFHEEKNSRNGLVKNRKLVNLFKTLETKE